MELKIDHKKVNDGLEIRHTHSVQVTATLIDHDFT